MDLWNRDVSMPFLTSLRIGRPRVGVDGTIEDWRNTAA